MPADILRDAGAAGLSVTIAPTGNLFVAPVERLTPELRALLIEHKPAVLDYLRQAHVTTAALIEAAMRCCDAWGDGDAAREAMRRDVLNTPEHLRADLLQHFRVSYGGKS